MNINKKLLALSVVLVAMGGCALAQADTHTISLGYASAKAKGLNNVRGATAKYHYQTNDSLGFIGSLTYMGSGNKEDSYNYNGHVYEDKWKVNYYSLLAGPSYRVNEYISFYGLVGIGMGKNQWVSNNKTTGNKVSETLRASAFGYGAGVQIAPAANWTVDVGYEGATFKDAKLNGFNIGLGYRF